jgi:predicted outer membrane repeat protein
MMKRIILVVLCCLTLPLCARAADYYVRPEGTRTSGASEPGQWSLSNCYATVDAACAKARNLDRVVLYKGGSAEIHQVTAMADLPAFLINMDDDNDFTNCIVEFQPFTKLRNRGFVKETRIRGITFRNHPEGDGYPCIDLKNETAWRRTVIIESCYFYNNKGNKATNGSGSTISMSDINTGGMDINIQDTIFTGNEASSQGGAIYLFGDVECIISNSLFTDNKAGIQNEDGGKGGALYFDSIGTGSLNIIDSTIDGNLVGSQGGAMYLANLLLVNIANTKIINNQSGLDESSSANGGAGLQVWLTMGGFNSIFTMSNCTVSRNIGNKNDINDAADGGGVNLKGIGPHNKITATVNDTIFSENHANQGAGLYVGRYSVATINRSSFINNTALTNGGASYKGGQPTNCLGETATYNSCVFIGNKAGFYQSGEPLPVDDAGKGGALMTRYHPRIVVNNCSFLENKANYLGDSFYHLAEGWDFDDDRQRCALVNSTFWGTGNHAEIESQKPFGFTEITNCAFADNELVNGGDTPNRIILTDNPAVDLKISNKFVSNNSRLTISPPSGTYLTKQLFDLSLILALDNQNVSITGSHATLDGNDVTVDLSKCVVPGTLVSDGQTFRCPRLTGETFGIGTHVISVTLSLSDGSSVGDTVTWEVLENTEP